MAICDINNCAVSQGFRISGMSETWTSESQCNAWKHGPFRKKQTLISQDLATMTHLDMKNCAVKVHDVCLGPSGNGEFLRWHSLRYRRNLYKEDFVKKREQTLNKSWNIIIPSPGYQPSDVMGYVYHLSWAPFAYTSLCCKWALVEPCFEGSTCRLVIPKPANLTYRLGSKWHLCAYFGDCPVQYPQAAPVVPWSQWST